MENFEEFFDIEETMDQTKLVKFRYFDFIIKTRAPIHIASIEQK